MNKIIVTTALPYINNSLHLGHILEGIQADIYVRFKKLLNEDVYFFCSDDVHGTATVLRSKKENISCSDLISKTKKEHLKDFKSFHINHDFYCDTNSIKNQQLNEKSYLTLKDKNLIIKKEIKDAFCNTCKIFLPDRYIKGVCPQCLLEDQYGDGCNICGNIYSVNELKNCYCAFCKEKPSFEKVEHIFFNIPKLKNQIQKWLDTVEINYNVKNQIQDWLHNLKEWDISREYPYFGFKIPNEENKYFYVWFDAILSYISTSLEYNDNFLDDWKNKKTKLVQFIGKDIIRFHSLFWVSLTNSIDVISPTKLQVHGFLNENNKKLSKRNINKPLSEYLDVVDPNYFRFYFASKLGNSTSDINLDFKELQNKINSELIGNIINIFSRSFSLCKKINSFNDHDINFVKQIENKKHNIIQLYNNCEYSKVISEILQVGDIINFYINDNSPWKIENNEDLKRIISTVLYSSKILLAYLYPIIPNICEKLLYLFGIEENFTLDNIINFKITNIREYNVFCKKITKDQIDSLEVTN